MPVVSEPVHPKGLNFASQRFIVICREQRQESWARIAGQVKNLSGEQATPRTVANYYRAFSTRHGRVRTKYHKCGRKPWMLTSQVEKWLLLRLRTLRRVCVCTSTTLQLDLAKQKGVKVRCSAIRKVLAKHGYKWLPRRQKRLYNVEVKKQRLKFANAALHMSKAQLTEKLSLAMDGVILTMPPSDPVDRLNFCRYGEDVAQGF